MTQQLTLEKIQIRTASVPLNRPIVAKVGQLKDWPLILIDIYTKEGIVGRSYLEPYRQPSAAGKALNSCGRQHLLLYKYRSKSAANLLAGQPSQRSGD